MSQENHLHSAHSGGPQTGFSPKPVEVLSREKAPVVSADSPLATHAMPAISEVLVGGKEVAPSVSASVEKKPSFINTFVEPRPNRLMLALTAPINRYFMLQGIPIIRDIPIINRLPLARGLLKLTEFDFPKADAQVVSQVLNRKTATFIGPNHPEFFTDWMVDKAGCVRVSPHMAHWADRGIVNGIKSLQWFWLSNNLIANVPGGGGKEYSINWALKGHGVLLHPEGSVHWTGNKVHKIFPGIVDMSLETAERVIASGKDTPVYMLGMISKHNFTRDVSKELHAEMKKVEKRLGFKLRPDLNVENRFVEIQASLLARREEKFELPKEFCSSPITAANFFKRQQQLFDFLLARLERSYGVQTGDVSQQIYRLEKAVSAIKHENKEQFKDHIAMVGELKRLQGFTKDVYGRAKLSQEEIAESLKRIKSDLVDYRLVEKVGWMDILRRYVPIPIAPRVAHIRQAGPIDVTWFLRDAGGKKEAIRDTLLNMLHANMQHRLDRLNEEISGVISKYERPNPFV